MKTLTGEEMVELLKKHGWYLLRISGSHYIMKKKGYLIIFQYLSIKGKL
ncbi:MAG: type II toxin-antitoxin system HicA family toxin [Nitrospirota bacterium]